MQAEKDADVIVVGAGPTGLLLAGDLAAAGVDTVVLERRDTESNLSRAFGVHARTMEELDARGVAEPLAETGAAIDRLRLFEDAEFDLSDLPSRFPYVLVTPQYETERVLMDRARRLGVEVVTGAKVVGVRQDDTGVEVETQEGDVRRSAYVVGADGVHSAVRQAVGLPYPGEAVVRSMLLVDVRLDRVPENALRLSGVDDCFAVVVPYGDGWYRIVAWDRTQQVPDDAPLDFQEIVDVVRRALGEDLGMHDPRWMSRFHSDERQVPDYRVGRVLLAGDAAHCHSPAGGMGMNTGLQDAANLGWKLAATVRGWAPDWLLDSYHAERHPVGRMVLRASGAIVRAAMIRSAVGRAMRHVVGGTLSRFDPAAHRIIKMISGVGISYHAPRGSHPSAGHRIGDLPLVDGTRLYEALRSGKFVLVGAGVPAAWASRAVSVEPADQTVPVTLVRPDGYIAWAGQTKRLDDALTTWLGAA